MEDEMKNCNYEDKKKGLFEPDMSDSILEEKLHQFCLIKIDEMCIWSRRV